MRGRIMDRPKRSMLTDAPLKVEVLIGAATEVCRAWSGDDEDTDARHMNEVEIAIGRLWDALVELKRGRP